MMINKKKEITMNKTETVKYLEENNISFFVYKNGDILKLWVKTGTIMTKLEI